MSNSSGNTGAARNGSYSAVCFEEEEEETERRLASVFEGCVVCLGFVGCGANGLVLAALLRSKQTIRRSTYLLIVNQILLDLFSSVFLVASYAAKLTVRGLGDGGGLGAALCLLLDSELMLWVGLDGSTFNLVLIAAERYVKVVHPVGHRKHFRAWMVRAGMAVAWANGALSSVPVTLTSVGETGAWCCQVALGRKRARTRLLVYGTVNFAWNYALPLAVFVFCYWRVFKVIVGRSKVTTRTTGSDAFVLSRRDPVMSVWRRQTIAVKTMTIITMLFAVLWLPNHVYFLLAAGDFRFRRMWRDVWYAGVFLAFLNVCLHPLVYAAKLDVVRESLRRGYFRRKLKVLPVAIASVSTKVDMQ